MRDVNVVKCARCGRIFARERRPICPECWKAEMDALDVVRRYLDENPGAEIPAVAEATGVSEKEIIRFIKEGHLVVFEAKGIKYPCEACGKPISIGRFCPTCGEKLTKGLEGAIRRARRREEEREGYGWKKTTPKRLGDEPSKD